MKEKRWNRSKVMFVGQGRAGKTSLTRLMLGHIFSEEVPSTCGIDKFEVNVSTGIVERGAAEQWQWQEYKQEGSHLNNALASMAAQGLSEQANRRFVIITIPAFHWSQGFYFEQAGRIHAFPSGFRKYSLTASTGRGQRHIQGWQ